MSENDHIWIQFLIFLKLLNYLSHDDVTFVVVGTEHLKSGGQDS